MIKVLIVVHQMEKGGLETRLMDILRHWDFSKVKLDIYTSSQQKGFYDEEILALGSKIYYNPPLKIWNMHQYINYFKTFLLKHPEYQIVHAYQDAWCAVYCKGADKAGVPIRIAHSRTAINNITLQNIVKNIIKLSVPKYATHFFAVSIPAAKWLYGNKIFNQGKAHIWPNAIDSKKFFFNKEIRQQVRQELKIQDNKVIMHVGNFTTPKNHKFILKIFEEVYQKEQGARLILVGGGNNKKYVKWVHKRGLDAQVNFLGSRNDIERLLQAADVFLFPSLYEGLPGAVMEAQAASLPCIISNRITNEVNITPLVRFISLEVPAKHWANEICLMFNQERVDVTKYFENNAFDIHILVKQLIEFYEEAKRNLM